MSISQSGLAIISVCRETYFQTVGALCMYLSGPDGTKVLETYLKGT